MAGSGIKNRKTTALRAALFLFLLFMVSLHMTSGLYARYVSVAPAAGSARVAVFSVAASSNMASVNIDNDSAGAPGAHTGSYLLIIDSDSEVDVEYDISLVFANGYENIVKNVSLDGGAPVNLAADGSVNFASAGSIESGPHAGIQHTVTFTADPSQISTGTVDSKIADYDNASISTATAPLPFNALVKFSQVD